MKRILLCLLLLCFLVGCGRITNNEISSSNQEVVTESVITDVVPDVSGEDDADMDVAEKESAISQIDNTETDNAEQNQESKGAVVKLSVTVNGTPFVATLEENTAVDALKEKLAEGELELSLSDYSGFEKVGALGFSLPSDNSQMTTQAGDIVLYNSNQIVIFYGSNSWSYTKLATIDDLTGWAETLGSGDAEVVLSLIE